MQLNKSTDEESSKPRQETRNSMSDGIRTVAAIQIISGLTCIGLQVFVFVYYRHPGEGIHEGNTLFTLAVGTFGIMTGIFGCLMRNHGHPFTSYVYVGTSLGVVGSSVLYFAAGYWDFYSALKDSTSEYFFAYRDESGQRALYAPAAADQVHFWLQASLFLCVVTLALFSLAGTALVASYRRCGRNFNAKEDVRSLLVDGKE